MSRRTTIMLDEDLAKTLRLKQANLIKKNKCSVTFSKVINLTLRRSLKK